MKDNASWLLLADSHISKISAFNQNNPDCKQNGTKREERARRVTNEPDFKAVSTNNRVPVQTVRVPFTMVRLRPVLALSRR